MAVIVIFALPLLLKAVAVVSVAGVLRVELILVQEAALEARAVSSALVLVAMQALEGSGPGRIRRRGRVAVAVAVAFPPLAPSWRMVVLVAAV
jgi:hypothetical protein